MVKLKAREIWASKSFTGTVEVSEFVEQDSLFKNSDGSPKVQQVLKCCGTFYNPLSKKDDVGDVNISNPGLMNQIIKQINEDTDELIGLKLTFKDGTLESWKK